METRVRSFLSSRVLADAATLSYLRSIYEYHDLENPWHLMQLTCISQLKSLFKRLLFFFKMDVLNTKQTY